MEIVKRQLFQSLLFTVFPMMNIACNLVYKCCPARRKRVKLKAQLKQTLDSLVERKVIMPSEWVSNLVSAQKRDNT